MAWTRGFTAVAARRWPARHIPSLYAHLTNCAVEAGQVSSFSKPAVEPLCLVVQLEFHGLLLAGGRARLLGGSRVRMMILHAGTLIQKSALTSGAERHLSSGLKQIY